MFAYKERTDRSRNYTVFEKLAVKFLSSCLKNKSAGAQPLSAETLSFDLEQLAKAHKYNFS